MGLMDKFKNLFTDEEIIDDEEEEVVDSVEIKEVKKEETPPKLPTFMREKIEKEEKDSNLPDLDINKEIKMENILDFENKAEGKSKFKFPIDLEDDDFIETRSRQSLHKARELEIEEAKPTPEPVKLDIKKPKKETKVADLYKDKVVPDEELDDKKFRATPIISPIYGVLDKNYTSSDVSERRGNNLEGKRHSKSVDFDSVRKKAYGSLADDIRENLMCDNCEYMKEAKDCRKKHEEKVEEPAYLDEDDITMDEAAENYFDYGVEYEKKQPKSVDIDLDKDDDVKIVNNALDEETPKKEIPPVKSSINLLSTLKKSMGEEDELPEKKADNLELTDDLFNLIDSMYDERDD